MLGISGYYNRFPISDLSQPSFLFWFEIDEKIKPFKHSIGKIGDMSAQNFKGAQI